MESTPTRSRPRRIRGLDADQRRAQRRQALLDAALDLFASQGYSGTTIEQLCQQAYVGTKAFYEAFESRDDLYLVLLQQIRDAALAAIAAAAEGVDDEVEGASRLLAVLARFFAEDVRYAKVTFGYGAAMNPEAERQRRINRRAAAELVEALWAQFSGESKSSTAHGIAIGVIGGLFDIIADWVVDLSGDHSTPAEVELLMERLTNFYGALDRARPVGVARTSPS